MRYIKIIWSLLLLPFICQAQNNSTLIEQQLKQAYRKAYPASVRAYGIDSVTGAQNSAQFSAVVVTADGILLTVAHAVKPGHLYRISFPDGKLTIARALGRIATDRQTLRPDVAMMKIIEPGPWPFAEMGSSAALAAGQFCFGISYPESQNLLEPMLRQGSITNRLNEWGFVESSCIMETGDSGGPLFDEQGKIIGLHSRIDKPEGANYEVPVDIYRKYFTSLQVSRNYDSLPEKQDAFISGKTGPAIMSEQETKKTAVLAVVPKKPEGVVKIYSLKDSILGTVFQLKNGRQVIVSKSSEVGDSAFINLGGQSVLLEILKRDRSTDLVALSISHLLSQPLIAKSLKPLAAGGSELKGRFLYTLLPDGITKNSVAGLIINELPNRFSSGGFNAGLQEQNGCPTITQTDSGGVAEKAGLKKGDCVLRINQVPVKGAKGFNTEMMKYYPGDTVLFSIRREQDTMDFALTLVPRILREPPHPMNRFEGGKSLRRDGFQHVILHDARVRSYECGSPLYDTAGKLVGINIARFSHTTTIALTIQQLLAFIDAIG